MENDSLLHPFLPSPLPRALLPQPPRNVCLLLPRPLRVSLLSAVSLLVPLYCVVVLISMPPPCFRLPFKGLCLETATLNSPSVETGLLTLNYDSCLMSTAFHLQRDKAEIKMVVLTSRFVYISTQRLDILERAKAGEFLSLPLVP